LGQLLTKRAHLIGTTLRLRPIEEKISLARSFNKTLLPLFETGQLRPVIDSRFPFSELGDAHEYLASNQSVGKVVIEILPA
jgi:NADPH:quinone reductase